MSLISLKTQAHPIHKFIESFFTLTESYDSGESFQLRSKNITSKKKASMAKLGAVATHP